jgi:predicted DNA-binding ribbon-helix-helix protein
MVSAARTAGGWVRTGVQLSEEQQAGLEEIARERQLSVSAIIRELVRNYLAECRRDKSVTAVG